MCEKKRKWHVSTLIHSVLFIYSDVLSLFNLFSLPALSLSISSIHNHILRDILTAEWNVWSIWMMMISVSSERVIQTITIISFIHWNGINFIHITIYGYKDVCVILLFFFSLLWFPLSSYDDNSEEYVVDDATINSLQLFLTQLNFFFSLCWF